METDTTRIVQEYVDDNKDSFSLEMKVVKKLYTWG